MSVTFPAWVGVVLTVASVVIQYLLSQTAVVFSAEVGVILGAIQVGIVALLSFFQRQTTRLVRRLTGRPTPP